MNEIPVEYISRVKVNDSVSQSSVPGKVVSFNTKEEAVNFQEKNGGIIIIACTDSDENGCHKDFPKWWVYPKETDGRNLTIIYPESD